MSKFELVRKFVQRQEKNESHGEAYKALGEFLEKQGPVGLSVAIVAAAAAVLADSTGNGMMLFIATASGLLPKLKEIKEAA